MEPHAQKPFGERKVAQTIRIDRLRKAILSAAQCNHQFSSVAREIVSIANEQHKDPADIVTDVFLGKIPLSR